MSIREMRWIAAFNDCTWYLGVIGIKERQRIEGRKPRRKSLTRGGGVDSYNANSQMVIHGGFLGRVAGLLICGKNRKADVELRVRN